MIILKYVSHSLCILLLDYGGDFHIFTVGQPGAAIYRGIGWHILLFLYNIINIKWFTKGYTPIHLHWDLLYQKNVQNLYNLIQWIIVWQISWSLKRCDSHGQFQKMYFLQNPAPDIPFFTFQYYDIFSTISYALFSVHL